MGLIFDFIHVSDDEAQHFLGENRDIQEPLRKYTDLEDAITENITG